jgi:RNA polymerase sigma-70 factor (ECF subfamily)
MDDRLRVPLVLHYYAGWGLAQIARTCLVPTGTVKSRLHKAREAVRLALKEHGYE